MTALLVIGEDNAAVADFAAAAALRTFDGAAPVAFFAGHSVGFWLSNWS